VSEPHILHPGLNIGQTDQEGHEQAEPIMFGFWVFLMSDLILFALLLATYASMTVHGIAAGPTPRDVTDLRSAAIETGLLLTSSFTFGLGSLALKYRGDVAGIFVWLGLTALLGLAFLGMEVRDFVKLIGEGAIPQRSGFLSAHFTLLGTHFLHVAAAILWLAILFVQTLMWGVSRAVSLRIMRLALFWHMLDVVWIALFTFVFLAGAA
jgi:cytochrome o ubiquinol oxidase subunit III